MKSPIDSKGAIAAMLNPSIGAPRFATNAQTPVIGGLNGLGFYADNVGSALSESRAFVSDKISRDVYCPDVNEVQPMSSFSVESLNLISTEVH